MIGRYLLVVALVFSATAGVSAAESPTPIESGNCISSTESVETTHADVNAVVEQPPNRSDVVRIRYQHLSETDRLEIELPSDVTIVRADGFRETDSTSSLEYTGGDQVVLEYRIGVSGELRQYANGRNWIFAPAPTHIGTGVDLDFKPAGTAGNRFLYIGNYTEYSTTNGCHEISLINSNAGELQDPPDDILQALDYTARNLDVGHKYEDVTIFATPGFARPTYQGFASGSDAWVTKSTAQDYRSYTRLYIHEYIHTRQAYNRGSIGGMSWFIEGSAEYLSFKMSRATGTVSPAVYNQWLKNGSQLDGVLTNRSSWQSRYVEYGRGGTYLAILDQRIQATSNNSLESVVRRINSVGGDESYVLVQRSLFLDTVENTSTQSVRTWANSSIDSAAPLNYSQATVPEQGFLASTIQIFEENTAKKPYLTLVLGGLIGFTLAGILIESNQPAEETKDKNE